jgi:hypothetical protein
LRRILNFFVFVLNFFELGFRSRFLLFLGAEDSFWWAEALRFRLSAESPAGVFPPPPLFENFPAEYLLRGRRFFEKEDLCCWYFDVLPPCENGVVLAESFLLGFLDDSLTLGVEEWATRWWPSLFLTDLEKGCLLNFRPLRPFLALERLSVPWRVPDGRGVV